MASNNAQIAKDKGNAAFKAGDYTTAVGAYTTAILADRSSPIYPLNRAAAYLKLGKYADAERDCNATLQLQPTHTKALFRRAQARIELDKLAEARKDLQEALRSEPSNDAVKAEITRLENLERQKASRKTRTPLSPAPNISVATPHISNGAPPVKRRRVPIAIVEPPSAVAQAPLETKSESTSSASLMNPVSSRSLRTPSLHTHTPIVGAGSNVVLPLPSTPSPPASRPVPAPTPAYSAKYNDDGAGEKSQARHKPTSSRSGGGIFRVSGQNTIFATREPPAAVPEHSRSRAEIATPALSLLEFTRYWNVLKSPEEQWKFLSQIPPEGLPSLFKSSLDVELLMSILLCFQRALNQDSTGHSKAAVMEYMVQLSKTARFQTVILFMSEKEKTLVREVWDQIGEDPNACGWRL